MRKIRHIILFIFCCFYTFYSFGQIGIGTTNPEQDKGVLKLDSSAHLFQNIQQNLIQESGRNTVEEAQEYYNLALLFIKDKDYVSAENNLNRSLDIYRLSQKKKSSKFSKKREKSLSFTTSKSLNQTYNKGVVQLKLVDVYLYQNKNTEAYVLIQNLRKNHSENKSIQFKALEVFQAKQSWQELLELCQVLEVDKSLSPAEIGIVVDKKTLAKTKLGLDDDLFLEEAETSFSDLDIVDFEMQDIQNDKVAVESNSNNQLNVKKVEQLSYETQDEIAKTYNLNKDFEKELSIRESLSNSKKLSEGKKAKQKLEIGKIHQKKKDNKKAIKALEESLVLAKQSNNAEVEKETLLKLIDLNTSDKKIIYYYKELQKNNQVLDSINRQNLLDSMLGYNGSIEKKEVVKNINKSRALYQKEQELSSKEESLVEDQMQFQRSVIWVLVLGLILMIAVLFWYHKQKKRLQNVNLLLELKNMRNQMNPHFIFNSLNAVNHFIAQRNELMANEYLTEFALLMRNTLNQSDMDLITLKEELVFLKRYCELEKMRFENKFDFVFDVDTQLNIDEYKIPPLLLQPFVENAVWHGLRYLEAKGELKISFGVKNEKLCIEITDNGIGRAKSEAIKTENQKKHKSKGVSLIKRRIDISNRLTPVHIDWEIENVTPNGTRVLLQLSKPKS